MMIVGTSSKVFEESKIGADDENRVSNDGRLIAEARSDPEAFARLYRRHYDVVFRYCVHRLFERHTAEDVTSLVFLKVVENLHSFKGTERQFRNWLYKIATNAVNDHLRKNARWAGLLKVAGEQADTRVADCESTAVLSDKKLAILREAMLDLRPRYQTIITLRFFENLKLTEIAEVLGSSDGTIRSQLARALAKLRNKMGTFQQEVLEND
ncbi:MAG: sigma-70 family RNA polymerase sigma factor [Planctomycetota bacterium]|nr:MAG: sigma-70 family RNA polymerase sigma factor [Planctomycetota bacterium]